MFKQATTGDNTAFISNESESKTKVRRCQEDGTEKSGITWDLLTREEKTLNTVSCTEFMHFQKSFCKVSPLTPCSLSSPTQLDD